MPVVALSEKGLTVDALGESPLVVPSLMYAYSKTRIASVRNGGVDFIDLESKSIVGSVSLLGASELKLSSNGLKTAVLCANKTLHIYDSTNKILEISFVEFFAISDTFLTYSTEDDGSWCIYDFEKKAYVIYEKASIVSLYAANTFVLAVSKHLDACSLVLFKNNEMYNLLSKESIYAMIVDVNKDETSCTVVLDEVYTTSSYYADSVLYLLLLDNKSGDVSHKIFAFEDIKKIHAVAFLDNDSFYVCHGPQPADLTLYSSKGNFIRSVKKTVRNRASFSHDKRRVINAGIGNLPGNIEVLENEIVTCSFEKLGTSFVQWMPDSTHFILCITSYFKSDNRISLYDYYGRLVKDVEFRTLNQVDVYGHPEKPAVIDPPATKNISKQHEAYIPPHLSMSQRKAPKRGPPKAVPKKAAPKAQSKRSKEDLEKEIALCKSLKERLGGGEDLSLEEQKKVFSLSQLLEEYKKME